MKRRRFGMYLFMFMIIGAMLSAMLFLPDTLFHLQTAQEQKRILVKDITAIDLTLTENLNREERMLFLTDPQTAKLPANTHTNSRNAAEYAASRFVTAWFEAMGVALDDPEIADSTPYLYSNPQNGQSLLCWSILFRFPAAHFSSDGDFFVRLTVDDTEFEVLQVYLYCTAYTDSFYMIGESLRGMLDRPFYDYSTLWQEQGDATLYDEEVKYEKPLPKYTAYALQLTSDHSSYEFILYETPQAVLFNMGNEETIYEILSLLY